VREAVALVGDASDVLPQEQAGTTLEALLRNPRAQSAAWSMVKGAWDRLIPRLGGIHSAARIVDGLEALPDRYLEDVDAFFKAHPLPDARRATQDLLDTLRERRDWVGRAAPQVRRWLEDFSPAP